MQALLHNARKRARREGVACLLRREDIRVPQRCPVLGLALAVADGHPGDASPTLDRLRPEQPYVAGNVVVMSHLANRIKNSAGSAQVARVAHWMQQQGL